MGALLLGLAESNSCKRLLVLLGSCVFSPWGCITSYHTDIQMFNFSYDCLQPLDCEQIVFLRVK